MKIRKTFYSKHKDEITIFLLASANIPVIYQWYTGYENRYLLLIFGISACVGLDFTVVTQTSKKQKNIFTWVALVLASMFTAAIAVSMYDALPIHTGYLHAAYTIVMLFTALSNSTEVSQKHKKAVSAQVKTEPKQSLTAKEQQVFDYLKEHQIEHTTSKELSEAMGMNNSSLRVYLSGLKRKGYVQVENGVISK